jgi:putative phage-type endonuclease
VNDDGQRTAAWFSARTGKLTASRMADAMARLKTGKPAAARIKYIQEMVAERLTDAIVPHYTTADMLWGIEQEPFAIAEYTLRTGREVRPCFFFDHFDIDNFGASPDGLVDDGLIEVKCPRTATHIAWVADGIVPEEHRPQMLAQMACTGRKWCDFVSFDPRIGGARRLFVVRFAPTAEEISKVEDEARAFLAEADALFDLMTAQE